MAAVKCVIPWCEGERELLYVSRNNSPGKETFSLYCKDHSHFNNPVLHKVMKKDAAVAGVKFTCCYEVVRAINAIIFYSRDMMKRDEVQSLVILEQDAAIDFLKKYDEDHNNV